MTVTREELVATRKRLAEEMHIHIIEMGDEKIWMDWITLGVPDEPSEEDFEWFAENDDEWEDLCKLFGELTKGEWEE